MFHQRQHHQQQHYPHQPLQNNNPMMMEPLKILTNELAENLGLGPHSKDFDSGYISPSNNGSHFLPGKPFCYDQQPPRVDPLLLQQVLQKRPHQHINSRPITGNHHRSNGPQYHNPRGPQFRFHHKLPPPAAVIPPHLHEHFDISSCLPPPEYLRNMPPPLHNNAIAMPKLPYMEIYDNTMGMRAGHPGYYQPPPPPQWRPGPGQGPMYRGGRPPIQGPPIIMNARHFRSGTSTELHTR